MITSPINPMRYWKLEEIQRMLNQIEGYEKVIIEFQCQQSDSWTTKWDCSYGIREQLVNGQWNWLLKHKFVIEEKTEVGAKNLAWQEAAERLVTDIWKQSIDSLRKEQPTPSVTKIGETTNKKTNTNTNTQTNKTWWTETKLWIVSSIFAITFFTLAWFYPMIALAICLIALGAIALYVFIWIGTILLKDALGLDDDE
jgi:cation transport ATPase